MKLKELLQGHKKIKIQGMKFVIKKINPLLDFQSDSMPQIFSDFVSKRKTEEKPIPSIEELNKLKDDMYTVIEAGLVYPPVVPIGKGEQRGKEEGVTVEDIFRDLEIGYKLYFEIINHCLNKFKGLRGVFFYLRLKLTLYQLLRTSMEKHRMKSSLKKAS
jgi:hypothetical protein